MNKSKRLYAYIFLNTIQYDGSFKTNQDATTIIAATTVLVVFLLAIYPAESRRDH